MSDDCSNPEIEKRPKEPTLFELPSLEPESVNPNENSMDLSDASQDLEGINAIVDGDLSEPEDNLKKLKLVAFGGFVKPEQYDIFGEHDFSDLTEKEKSWFDADKFRELIINNPTNYQFVVDEVALNPYEYNLIARSPSHLGKFAVAKVLNDNDLSDERISASQRAPVHVLTQKIEAMTNHDNKLREQLSFVRELRKEIRAPGFAHKTEERMKLLISASWNEFTTMLDVMSLQRGWDDDKRQRAETALLFYLTQGGQSLRISKWAKMTKVADDYLVLRKTTFSRKINQSERELTQYPLLIEESTQKESE